MGGGASAGSEIGSCRSQRTTPDARALPPPIARNVGKSITATCATPARSWRASAIRRIPSRGNGAGAFIPVVDPGECTGGTAETFDEARADFEAAWKVFLSNRTEADFQAWRDQEAWTAEKYRRVDCGDLPPWQV
jgi:hypothetical protein